MLYYVFFLPNNLVRDDEIFRIRKFTVKWTLLVTAKLSTFHPLEYRVLGNNFQLLCEQFQGIFRASFRKIWKIYSKNTKQLNKNIFQYLKRDSKRNKFECFVNMYCFFSRYLTEIFYVL